MRNATIAGRSLVIAGLGLSMCGTAIAQEAADTAVDLPSASSLFERCFGAMAEEATLEKIESATFTVVPPEMLGDATIKVSAMAPDKCRVDASIAEGEAHIVQNGEHLWSQGPGEPLEYGDNQEMGTFLVMFAPQYFLHSAQTRFETKTSGMEKVGEHECYKVDLSKGEEDVEMSIFFNKETGLCAGFGMMNPMMGTAAHFVVDSWGEADGLKVITKASMDMSDVGMPSMSFEFKDFVFNKVDAKIFELTDEVKKAAAEAKAGKADEAADVIRN